MRINQQSFQGAYPASKLATEVVKSVDRALLLNLLIKSRTVVSGLDVDAVVNMSTPVSN